MTPAELLSAIPQRPPFRFVDEIMEVDVDHISGRYTFPKTADYYAGHFPGWPITPGVLLLECMCQIGVVALGVYLFRQEYSEQEASKWTTVLCEANSEFVMPVLPGQTAIVRAQKVYWRRRKLCCDLQMEVAGQTVARARACGIGVPRA